MELNQIDELIAENDKRKADLEKKKLELEAESNAMRKIKKRLEKEAEPPTA